MRYQGYGLTEDGTTGQLREANVTVISNEDCTEMWRHNASQPDGGAQIKRQLTNALPNGIDYGLLCAQGKSLIHDCFALFLEA